MKKFVILIFTALLISGCSKEVTPGDEGIITGYDYRKCMCCGGWFIQIQDSTYRFDVVPEDCTIDFENANYPMEVWVKWEEKDPQCLGDEIIVSLLQQKN
jgi:hypothetical protein